MPSRALQPLKLFISYLNLVQTLKNNAFELLVRYKIDLYKSFLSILYSVGARDQKLLYAELLEHETCCDHFLYLSYYFSTLLYSDHVFSVSSELIYQVNINWNPGALNLLAVTTSRFLVNSDLIIKFAWKIQFRFFILSWD